jgi:hypothetical protein
MDEFVKRQEQILEEVRKLLFLLEDMKNPFHEIHFIKNTEIITAEEIKEFFETLN